MGRNSEHGSSRHAIARSRSRRNHGAHTTQHEGSAGKGVRAGEKDRDKARDRRTTKQRSSSADNGMRTDNLDGDRIRKRRSTKERSGSADNGVRVEEKDRDRGRERRSTKQGSGRTGARSLSERARSRSQHADTSSKARHKAAEGGRPAEREQSRTEKHRSGNAAESSRQVPRGTSAQGEHRGSRKSHSSHDNAAKASSSSALQEKSRRSARSKSRSRSKSPPRHSERLKGQLSELMDQSGRKRNEEADKRPRRDPSDTPRAKTRGIGSKRSPHRSRHRDSSTKRHRSAKVNGRSRVKSEERSEESERSPATNRTSLRIEEHKDADPLGINGDDGKKADGSRPRDEVRREGSNLDQKRTSEGREAKLVEKSDARKEDHHDNEAPHARKADDDWDGEGEQPHSSSTTRDNSQWRQWWDDDSAASASHGSGHRWQNDRWDHGSWDWDNNRSAESRSWRSWDSTNEGYSDNNSSSSWWKEKEDHDWRSSWSDKRWDDDGGGWSGSSGSWWNRRDWQDGEQEAPDEWKDWKSRQKEDTPAEEAGRGASSEKQSERPQLPPRPPAPPVPPARPAPPDQLSHSESLHPGGGQVVRPRPPMVVYLPPGPRVIPPRVVPPGAAPPAMRAPMMRPPPIPPMVPGPSMPSLMRPALGGPAPMPPPLLPRLPMLPGSVPPVTKLVVSVPVKLKVNGDRTLGDVREHLRDKGVLVEGSFFPKGSASVLDDVTKVSDLEDKRLLLYPERQLQPWQLGLLQRPWPAPLSGTSQQDSTSASQLLYKTRLCKFWQTEGRCVRGPNCVYAHGERELRQRPLLPPSVVMALRPALSRPPAPRPTEASIPEVVFTVDDEEQRKRAERAKRFAARPASFELEEAAQQSEAAEKPPSSVEAEQVAEDASRQSVEPGGEPDASLADEEMLGYVDDSIINDYLESMQNWFFSLPVPEGGDAGVAEEAEQHVQVAQEDAGTLPAGSGDEPPPTGEQEQQTDTA